MSKFLKIDHSHPALSSHACSSRLSPPAPLERRNAQIYYFSVSHACRDAAARCRRADAGSVEQNIAGGRASAPLAISVNASVTYYVTPSSS